MFDNTEKSILKVERVIFDLKQGIPAIIRDKNSKIMLTAVESIEDLGFQRLTNNHKNLQLLLSKDRASHLFKNTNSDILIAIDQLSYTKVLSLSFEDPKYITLDSNYKLGKEIHKHIISLLQIAELMPAAIVANIDKKPIHINEITIGDIQLYIHKINRNYKIVVEAAPLNLKHQKAMMYAFRPSIGGKDHYAIMIGSALTSKAPIVRVHSSCFTGDLLNSISCDCYDQLHQSLQIMHDDPEGGILIYLNQEGRGIGLTNKLRAYILQENGYDTVEANEILGFSDDQRIFYPAAAILNLLNIKKIRLLTNNPKKSQGLEDLGIKVIDKIPIIACDNDRVKKYYEIKEKKLGHKFS